ncbi:MAG TPA: TetR family transcriptional regulator [Acidimicrobiales bacterium]|nr:TetR family transcriptional regulator [Acidimicrobiales bacterium]
MSAVGRRPGNADTRGEIVEAAKRVFADKGYEGTSLRGVAREAGVDPALVHHYFDGKASLFVAAMALPFDPREVKEHAAGREYSGSRTIEGFLTMWDLAEGTGSSFASCLSAMAASTNVADAMREFVNDRVWSVLRHNEGEAETLRRRRTAMVSSQLMGLAFARYILRVPPMSTASPKQIGRWVGPTLDRYVKEPLES